MAIAGKYIHNLRRFVQKQKRKSLPSVLTVAVLAALSPATGMSQGSISGASPDNMGAESDWHVNIGLAPTSAPEYPGSDETEATYYPYIDAEYKNQFYINMERGIGFYLHNNGPLKLGLGFSFVEPRDESDSDELQGLGDIDGGANAVAFTEYSMGKNTVELQLSNQISGDNTGFLLLLRAARMYTFGGKYMLSPAVFTSFASADHMEAYFGVTAAQQQTSGKSQFNPDSGLRSAGAGLSLVNVVSSNWQVFAALNAERLLGDAADSPIVVDENQYSGSVGFSYKYR